MLTGRAAISTQRSPWPTPELSHPPLRDAADETLSDRCGRNAGLQPTAAASHTAAVTTVTPCRH
ncbi:MAG: hypothetical protein SH850_00640 [Planctomycetaceae bacterium]|nr:hypothetical protein [Planctomycetaceae bacterium]